jgi:D-lactate dehydrogenase
MTACCELSKFTGTGRNMAPFLSLEWGREGMELMREIKDVFDPSHILNPGVILNDDPRVHVANLKHITPVTPSPLPALSAHASH